MSHEGSRILEDMEVKLKHGEERVLQGILRIYTEKNKPVEIEEIRDTLIDDKGKKPSKVWIYKVLRSLRDGGFIIVQTNPPPSRYIASEDTITGALMKLRQKRIAEIEERIDKIQDDLELLSGVSSQDLALHVVKEISGAHRSEFGRIVQGIDNVRQAYLREIIDVAREGDTIRVTQDVSTFDTLMEGAGPIEEAFIGCALRGVTLRVVMTGLDVSVEDMAPLASHFTSMPDLLGKGFQSGNIGMRILTDSTPSYRMVSLNDEKMILLLTTLAHPDIVAVVTKDASPFLIEDAVREFDRMFEEGLDFAEIFKMIGVPPDGTH